MAHSKLPLYWPKSKVPLTGFIHWTSDWCKLMTLDLDNQVNRVVKIGCAESCAESYESCFSLLLRLFCDIWFGYVLVVAQKLNFTLKILKSPPIRKSYFLVPEDQAKTMRARKHPSRMLRYTKWATNIWKNEAFWIAATKFMHHRTKRNCAQS